MVDRLLASRMGARAVDMILRGETGKMVGRARNLVEVDLEEVLQQKRDLDMEFMNWLGFSRFSGWWSEEQMVWSKIRQSVVF